MPKRLSVRYGQRGSWLIILGVMWVIFGIGVFLEPIEDQSWVIVHYAPDWVRALVWVITGTVALTQGMYGPLHRDYPGHVALYLMPAIQVISFAISYVLYLGSAVIDAFWTDVPLIGWDRGWYAALVWLFIVVMIRLIADWPNPIRGLPHPPPGAREEM